MKKTFTLLSLLLVTVLGFSQHMSSGQKNFTTFTTQKQKKVITPQLEANTPAQLRSHAEYGILPYGIPTKNCYEVLEKRTIDSRYYQDLSSPTKFYLEKANGPMHFLDAQNNWVSIDSRLRPVGENIYAAPNQAEPKVLNMKAQYSSITVKGVEMKFNQNLHLWHEAPDGTRTDLGKANWSKKTVGDEGAEISNVWKGVDMHITYKRNMIKTDFVLNQAPAQKEGFLVITDDVLLPNGFQFVSDPSNGVPVTEEGIIGNVLVMNAQGENFFSMGTIYVYDAKVEKKRQQRFPYKLDNAHSQYEIRIPMTYLQDVDRRYPVTIDPAVTGPISTYNLGDIPFIDAAASYCVFNLASYCASNLSVTTPANSTITNAYMATAYVALDWLSNGSGCGLSDCFLNEAAFSVQNTNCSSNSGLYTCSGTSGPGDCYTVDALGNGSPSVPGYVQDNSIVSPLSCNPPQCTPYNITFEMRTHSCFSCSGGCQTNCHYMPNGIWKMYLEGHTLEIDPITVSGSTTICQGASVTLTAPPVYGVPNYVYSWSPGAANTSSITVTPASTTTYSVFVSDACGSSVNTSQTITVNPPANAEFVYSAAAYCQGGANQLPIHNAGGVNGTYTVAPAGLSINSSTGLIDLTASSPGTYTVTNTVSAVAPCTNDVETFVVTVIATPVADFNYSSAAYCQNAANPSPIYTGGGVAGSFTALPPIGLSLNAATGSINLAASTAGTYTVTNTVTNSASGLACVDIATATVTINATPNASFNYDANSYCLNGANPVLTVTGVSGTFTSVPALGGLASNGAINLAACTAGSYTITNTVTVSGCTNTATQVITLVNAAVADFAYDQAAYCQTGTAPVLSYLNGGIAGTFTAAPAGLSVNSATGAITLASSTAGTYTVTNIVTIGTCNDTATSTITINASPNAAFNYNGSSFCQTATDPILNVTGIAGTFTAIPALGGLSTNGSISLAASTAGSYTITNTVTVSGCTSTASIPLTISTAPIADFSYDAPSYCQSGANPVLSFVNGGTAGTFSSSPAGLSLNTATGAINLAASTAGTYTVTNTATSAGCPNDVATFALTVVAVPNAQFTYSTSSFCQSAGATTTPLHLGGGTNGVYTSSPAGLSINASTGVIDIAASTAGTYTVTNTVSGAGVCPNDAQNFTVTIVSPSVAAFTYGSTTFCISGGTNPSPTFVGGGVAGVFTSVPVGLSLNTTTGVIDLTASAVGTYTVTNSLAASGPCPAVNSTQTITISNTANAEFTYGAATFCQSAPNPTPQHLSGGANGVYSSTGGLIINASTGVIDLLASIPGVYVVTNTIAASGGCAAVSYTQSVTISPAPNANFSYGVAAFCQTAANNPAPGHPTGGTDGTYTGNPAGLSINAATGLIDLATSTPGTYTVTNTVAGNAGCPAAVATQTVTISSPLNAAFAYSSNTYCNTGTATPSYTSGGVAGTYAYTVVTGGPTLIIDVNTGVIDLALSSPGVYQITNSIPASAGCAATSASQVIVISPAPSANFVYNPTSYCITGNDPVATLSAGAMNGAYSYTSPTGGTISLDPANGSINLAASTPGTYIITNTLLASGGCSGAAASQTITISSGGDAEFAYNDTAFCKSGANPILTHTTGANGVYSYTVIGGGPSLSLDPVTGAINLAASDAGSYEVSNTIAANGGCAADVVTFDIAIENLPDAEFHYDKSIYCGLDIPVVLHTSGVNGTYSYTTLNGGPSILLNPTTGSIDLTFSNSGTYQVRNIVSGNACPADTHDVVIVYAQKPVAQITPTGVFDLCTSGNIVLQASGGAAYQWLNYGQATGSITDIYTVTTAGNYSAIVYNSVGCSDTTDIVVVTNSNTPSVSMLTGSQTICPGQTATLLADGQGTAFQWSMNGTAIQGATGNSIAVNQAGIYTFSASNACGKDSASVIVSVSPGPQADFYWEPSTVYAGQSFSFIDQSLSGYTWSWNFGNGGTSTIQNPNGLYQNAGTYQVSTIVSDAIGCLDTVTKLLTVSLFTLPPTDSLVNTFTPNGDGSHDEFVILNNSQGLTDYQVTIFDRWGIKVFESKDPSRNWNGYNLNGVACSSGVYYYVFSAKDTLGKAYTMKGYVNLFR